MKREEERGEWLPADSGKPFLDGPEAGLALFSLERRKDLLIREIASGSQKYKCVGLLIRHAFTPRLEFISSAAITIFPIGGSLRSPYPGAFESVIIWKDLPAGLRA
ncbi:MAG: hypothetical protein WBE72_25335 [Terracidiphilus sp.]